MKGAIHWIAAGLATAWVLLGLRQPETRSEFDLEGFGRLPVIVNGRLQPMDSAARNALVMLRGKQTAMSEDRKRISAIEWLVNLTMAPEQADRMPVFRIDHPEVRSLLNLAADGPNYFAFHEMSDRLDDLQRQAENVQGIGPKDRTAFDRAVLKLQAAVVLYDRLKYSFQPGNSTNLLEELKQYERSIVEGISAWRARQRSAPHDEQQLDRLRDQLKYFESVVASDYLLVIPPQNPEAGLDGWQTFGAALLGALSNTNIPSAVSTYAALVTARKTNKPDDFNSALREYRGWLANLFPAQVARVNREFIYRHWQPFLKSMVLYACALVLGFFSWLGWFKPLNRTAFGLATVAFAVHTAGIIFRMIIEGRPPVTNLYSSAVFVGWGAAALGLVLERIQKDGVGLALSTTIGLITLIIAHNLALGGDTMEALRAVLDSNFWLATHVITITLGYSAMFVAGFIGVIYVVRGALTKSLNPDARARLSSMAYGTICFATLFSFLGTVLGGVWADQSWGRFWGWDPKENGALLVVLWCAIILHARAAGMVRDRGLMNLAIFGNAVTSFSWFGVNMLGVGLHAYGFMDSASFWLAIFVALQLAFIGLNLLPNRYRAS
ncbi:MAG: cytochrome c biogenesis protein CcsA [Verrucomicrobiota bacterium]|nr:cytochrome c biogenesis protein CcsA [Verrucomicrobiota bacterium]